MIHKKHSRLTIVAIICSLTLIVCGCSESGPPEKVSAEMDALLRHAESFELMSLNPTIMIDPDQPERVEEGWETIGTLKIADPAERTRLIDELYESIRNGDDQMAAACFIPRHGIRAKRGGESIELIICFECIMLKMYKNGVYTGHISIANDGDYFNEVLKANGIPLATN